jgi:hypothetical protein
MCGLSEPFHRGYFLSVFCGRKNGCTFPGNDDQGEKRQEQFFYNQLLNFLPPVFLSLPVSHVSQEDIKQGSDDDFKTKHYFLHFK